MANQGKNFDSANLENVYNKHGDIIGNMCKNVKNLLASDTPNNISELLNNTKNNIAANLDIKVAYPAPLITIGSNPKFPKMNQ